MALMSRPICGRAHVRADPRHRSQWQAAGGVPVDIWHADDDGYYDSQKPSYATQGPSSRARFITDSDGRLFFRTILPCSYPIPTDGPAGRFLR